MQATDRFRVALMDIEARLIRTRKMDESKTREEIEKILSYLDTLRNR